MESLNVATKKFYGKNCITKLGPAVLERAQMMQEKPIPFISYRSSISGETQIWKTFARQVPAIEFAKKICMDLMVFSYESEAVGAGGKRNFVVCHPKKMWNILIHRPISYRCTYEVILENHICKLYFDLEFLKELNPDADGSKMVKVFINIVNYFIKKEFDIDIETRDILMLDSTTDKKFSRHLIYNSGIVFKNNIHAGKFVTFICDQLRNRVNPVLHVVKTYLPETDEDISKLFIKGSVLFCDEGVYTKNRNFRTYQSTKYKRNTPFTVSSDSQYLPVKGLSEESYFLDSLITYIPKKATVVCYGSENMEEDIGSRCKSKEYLGSGCKSKEYLDSGSENNSFRLESGARMSPFPSVDIFIESLLGEGVIRSWQYFKEGKILLYDISKLNRFCLNISREHKSNTIMIIVNLIKGVYYQKCHDPDCRDFKSNEFPLPEHLHFSTKVKECLDKESEEALLLEAVVSAEEQVNNSYEKQSRNKHLDTTDNCNEYHRIGTTSDYNINELRLNGAFDDHRNSLLVSDDELLEFATQMENDNLCQLSDCHQLSAICNSVVSDISDEEMVDFAITLENKK